MPTPVPLAEQFEEHRAHLRAVGYRMLGSVSEAEDAVQETWIRLSRTDVSGVDNLRGYGLQAIDRNNTGNLREQPLEQAEIPTFHSI